jgi:serine/threonine-protein kinase
MESDHVFPTVGGSSAGGIPPADQVTVISAGSAATPPAAVSPAAIGTALQGTMLGPYRLEQFVGGGGMGAVFRAHDTTLDRVVAVKVLSRTQSADEDMLRRFRNEAQSAARLDHENIGRVHAVGSDRGWHYIVFEFIEGRNLRDVVRDEGPFAVGRAIEVAIQVADALEHASERDVVHRDIKPSNIVITPAGRARVVDMGLARLAPAAGDADLTVSGMTLGTFDYISPEQARDPRAADVRSDLYSLGCTLFFMLAGRPPFAEGTMVQKLLQHQQDPPPAIEAIRPDVPQRLAAILARLMEKDPTDRYQRPAVLAADLVACAEENGIAIAAPRPAMAAPVPPPAMKTVLPWLVPVGGLLALVGALWLQAAADRSTPVEPGEAGPAATFPAEPAARVSRVAEADASGDAGAAIAAAVVAAADGDVVELDFSGPRDASPLRIQGKRVTVRAATGRAPVLRFTPADAPPSGPAVACGIVQGGLRVQGVNLRLASPAGVACTMFALDAAALGVEDSLVEFESPFFAEDGSGAESAFVTAAGGGPGCQVTIARSRVHGDAVFLTAAAPARVSLAWTEGEFVSPQRLVVATGAAAGTPASTLDCLLDRGVFACRAGAVLLRDSPARPVPPRLQVVATESQFLTDGGPLIEQSGWGEAEAYREAVVWQDRGSRYEGSDVFRHIDGAAGGVTEGFAEQDHVFRHSPRVATWPAAATWAAAAD